MDYIHYTIVDFAQEESFLRWVKYADPEATAFWTDWLAAHPERRSDLAAARQLVIGLKVQENDPTPARVDALWSRIATSLVDAPPVATPIRRLPIMPTYRWLAYAAAIGALVIVSLAAIPFSQSFKTVAGEQQRITLRDGSQVILNAASAVTYRATLLWPRHRNVRMTGEVFFEVQKGSPFIVSSPSGKTEVLGTSFNIKDRDGLFAVDCLTGKVRVSNAQRAVILTPGLSTARRNQLPLQEPFPRDTTETATWRSGKFYFREATLGEVLAELSRQYQVDIQTTPEILRRTTTTYFETGNLDTALYKVCWPMQLAAERQGKTVLIR